MGWPTAKDYFEAIQHPLRRFCRPELQRAQVVLDARGKPKVRSGKRVDVYELRGAGGQERWAIGCFTQPPRGLGRRYELINSHLQGQAAPVLMETAYHEQGICIRGRWYPITRSRWVEGQALNAYVGEYLDYPDELRLLADVWVQLAHELRRAGIAHGNLASDTVLVVPRQGRSLTLRLVDYDALFVPALAEEPPEEMGHPDFQHPNRDWQRVYNAEADRFSQLVVLTALYALAIEGRALWDRFDNGGNLLFRHSDFQEPADSPLFRELWQSESSTVRTLVGQLILASSAAAGEVPPLELAAEYLKPGAARSALNACQVERINKLLDINAGPVDFKLEVDDASQTAPGEVDNFVKEVQEPQAPSAVATAVRPNAVRTEPLPLPASLPPSLPKTPAHPLTQTFQFDAWMPEQIAVLKLQGFVKDAGGEIINSIPGYIRVHLLDDRDLAQPPAGNLLSWLGLVQEPPPDPRPLAVLELHLVHKPTPTRQLIGITMRLTPGCDDEALPSWKEYCKRIFCELRGYMIGVGAASCSR